MQIGLRAMLMSFADVRWNGNRRAAQLRGKPVSLVRGELPCNGIDPDDELHPELPRLEITKRLNGHEERRCISRSTRHWAKAALSAPEDRVSYASQLTQI